MLKRAIIGVIVAVALLGAGIAIGSSVDGDWGPRHEVVVSGGGADAGAAQTIVVSDGHGPHGFLFFPFGLLFVVLIVFLVVSLLRRGRGRGGPWQGGGGGGTPPWFDEWHRRAHEGEATPGAGGATTA